MSVSCEGFAAMSTEKDDPEETRGRRWVWVFGDIAGLRWVTEHKKMAFPQSATPRARQIRRDDRAVLYTSRSAYNNPSRDEARLTGVATVTGPCEPIDAVKIGGREFTWACPITLDLLLPDRHGPSVRELAGQLQLVKHPQFWGGYFRNSPVEIGHHDWAVLTGALHAWHRDHGSETAD